MSGPDPKKRRRVIVKRPPLKDYQLSAFFHHKRYAWIEGTTKSGKTHTGIVWLFEEAVSGRFKNYWWVAPTYKAAKIAYTRMLAAIPKGLRKPNETDLTITLPNGHIIWFLSGEKPDNLYGEDVGAVVIDEASRLRAEAWHAVRSVTTYTAGKVRAIGNVKGKKNWFYQKCRETQEAMASSTETNAHWALITAADAVREGILPQSEIDDARASLPHDVFMELYYGVPTEDGSNPFGLKFIASCAILEGPSKERPESVGVDVARAVDWTVVLGLDAVGDVCLFDRFQKPWEEFYSTVYQLTDPSSSAALVDSTGLGDVVLSRLQKDRPRRFDGYKFTSESKQRLMEGLAVAIQHGEVRIPKSGPLRMELENFEYEYTRTGVRYSAPEGFHDDCVMALALAVAHRAKKIVQQAGRIYMNWGDSNEWDALPEYHRDCWNRGKVAISNVIAPSDRRPWSVIWFATFFNEDVVAFAEWPGFDMQAQTASPMTSVEDYRRMILDVETGLQRDIRRSGRVADPDYFDDAPGGLRALLAKPCVECAAKYPKDQVREKCTHRLVYRAAPDLESIGHAAVRAAVGNAAAGHRPKLYAMREACSNFCFAMRHYAYHEEKNPEKGAGERPQKRDRGMSATALFLYNAKLHLWPKDPGEMPKPEIQITAGRRGSL